MVKTIIPVIICGGSGTRLWPLSRKSFPKQFLSINNSNNSLLQKTQNRLKDLENLNKPILICNEEHRFIVAEQMREINIKPFSIILEPFGRNTAPAITIGALKALELKDDPDPILLVLSSDHEIKDEKKFLEIIDIATKYAIEGRLVTFGIIPNSPNTGYGYIKAEEPFQDNDLLGKNIVEFTEKPNLERAKQLIKDKRFIWNSGIFLFKAKTILEQLNKYCPDIVSSCKSSMKKSIFDLDFQRIDKESFKSCPNISIDHSIMEKTDKGTVLPLNVGWSDIGSWEAVWNISDKDENGNYLKGKTLLDESRNCYVRSEHRLVAGIGLNDLIIIETNDAVLVSEKSQSQKVKDLVRNLQEKKITEGQNHKKMFRPWGHYISIVEESRWQVKLIYVKQGEKLSLQMHHHRSEHWVVVNGTAKVEINKKIDILTENESIYIPLGAKHRLSNPGKLPLILIEVQSGSYLGEDDIKRFDDKYGRNENQEL